MEWLVVTERLPKRCLENATLRKVTLTKYKVSEKVLRNANQLFQDFLRNKKEHASINHLYLHLRRAKFSVCDMFTYDHELGNS